MAESHKWLKPKELREISRAYCKPYPSSDLSSDLEYTISHLLADLEAAKALLEQLYCLIRPWAIGEVSAVRTLLDEIRAIPGVGE